MSASASGQHSSWSSPEESRQSHATAVQTHYDLLGVPYSASQADITRAYREAMRRAHPDHRSPAQRAASEEHAKQLNAAYAILSKPASRLAYDRTIRQEVVQEQIMSRYVGGFDTTMGSSQASDHDLRRAPSAAERREQALSDRQALMSLVVVFGGIAVAVVGGLLLWSVLSAVIGAFV